MRLSVEEGGKFYFYNDVETFEEEPHPYKVVYEEDLCVLDEIYSRQIFLTPFLRWGYYGGLSLALHCICPPGNVYVFFNIVRVGLKFSVCPQTQWILFDFRSASYAPINSKSQHPSPPPPPPEQTPGIWTFEDWIVQIPAPSGQNGVQMPYPIVGFVCHTLLKNNRCRLLSSLIKTFFVS